MNDKNIDAVAVLREALKITRNVLTDIRIETQRLEPCTGHIQGIADKGINAVAEAIAATDRASTVAKDGGEVLVPIKITDAMIDAALAAHYGRRRLDAAGGAGGIDLTVNDTNYSGKEAMRRMWKGALSATPKPEASAATQQAGKRRKATDAEIAEWVERHNLQRGLSGSGSDNRAAFEDAESLHMTFAAPISEDADAPSSSNGELSPTQIDDMAFGYCPSGKIGELRKFAQACIAADRAARTPASVGEDAAVDAVFPVQNSPHGSVVTRNQEERAAFRKGFQAAVNICASQIPRQPCQTEPAKGEWMALLKTFDAISNDVHHIIKTDAPELHKALLSVAQSPAQVNAESDSQSVRDGWKWVPVEPTQEMFAAARTSASGSSTEKQLMASYWRNMLAAAPSVAPVEAMTLEAITDICDDVIRDLDSDAAEQSGAHQVKRAILAKSKGQA